MGDEKKTKRQLINELQDLRQSVADLKTSEDEFKKAKDALSIVFDAVDSTVGGIIITNNYGQITYVNPSFLRMFEYNDKSEIIGKNASDFFPGNEIRKFADVGSIIDLTDGETEEFTVQRKDGKAFVVVVSSSNVTNSEGNIVGRMASFVNITSRKQLEQEKESLIEKLQNSLREIKALRGFIPICASCKNVRDDRGFWHKVEEYIRDNTEAQLSHSICPECVQKLYPEIDIESPKVVTGL
jgi:PAS domain S-box-containing protein